MILEFDGKVIVSNDQKLDPCRCPHCLKYFEGPSGRTTATAKFRCPWCQRSAAKAAFSPSYQRIGDARILVTV